MQMHTNYIYVISSMCMAWLGTKFNCRSAFFCATPEHGTFVCGACIRKRAKDVDYTLNFHIKYIRKVLKCY